MSSTASVLAALICVLVPKAAAIKCLSCTDSVRPLDCEYVQECGSHEKCSIESYLTTTGYIRYDVGCMDDSKCAAIGRKRAVLNATVLELIQQKIDFGTIPEEQWDRKDMLICAECCDTELCNIKGCSEEGLPPNSGPICYGCDQQQDPDKCNRTILCHRDYACHLSTIRVGMDLVYKSGCILKEECHQQGVLDIGAYNIVGRRGVDMTRRFKRSVLCNKCCSKNLCNSDNCSSLTYPASTVPPTLAPVNGEWNSWSHWNLCSVTCGEGHHYRVRFCNNPSPANGGAVCSGPNKETQSCNDRPCAVNGEWNSWSHWNLCSVTCGEGHHYRVRFCNNPSPANGGAVCSGPNKETQSCNDRPCAVDGNFSDWSLWSACIATCGSSVTRSRTRTCTNPAPSSGGAKCVGTVLEAVSCNLGACPVDAYWSNWGLWSACAAICGSPVTRNRTRTCTAPAPGGASCIGAAFEAAHCYLGARAVDGNWYDWGPWSACTATCGSSTTRSRTRTFINPAASAGGTNYVSTAGETVSCNLGTCPAGWKRLRISNVVSITLTRLPDNIVQSKTLTDILHFDQQFIQSAQNFTQPMGSHVVINCLVLGGTPPEQVPNITWTDPQIIDHPFPSNVAQLRNGSLFIDGLKVENIGAYSCTLTTDCGTYDSPTFWVNMQ